MFYVNLTNKIENFRGERRKSNTNFDCLGTLDSKLPLWGDVTHCARSGVAQMGGLDNVKISIYEF